MKKEYIILIAIIVSASLYLFMHKENSDNYTLPEVQTIDTSKLTGIIIKKDKETIKFIKNDKEWTLTDKGYPVDSTSLQDMLDVFNEFKLTALVSEKNDLQRYELDKTKQIHIKLLEKEKTIFEFTIGKPAPSYNHTFVMIADDKNIYHANGSFRSDFDKTVDDFKQKEEKSNEPPEEIAEDTPEEEPKEKHIDKIDTNAEAGTSIKENTSGTN